MTCAELLENSFSHAVIESRFVDKLKELSSKFINLNAIYDAKLLNKPVITNLMWAVRSLPTTKRKEYYIENRIEE